MAIHDIKDKLTCSKDKVDMPDHSKTNILERLDTAMSHKTPTNRSADLVPLKQDYEKMRSSTTKMIQAAKKYHESIETMDKARMDTANIMTDLMKNSPLMDNAHSYENVMDKLSNNTKSSKMRYRISVIEYIEQLQNNIVARVTNEEKEVDELHHKLKHYQHKVDKLRGKVRSKEANPDKKVSEKKTSKLTRNEDKLGRAWHRHESRASQLCDLLEEITKHGWKDLYETFEHMMSFERDFASQNYNITAELENTKTQLHEIYKAHYNDRLEQRGSPAELHNDAASINSDTSSDVSDASYHDATA